MKSILQRFFPTITRRGAEAEISDADRDLVLSVFASDAHCRLTVKDRNGREAANFVQDKAPGDSDQRSTLAMAVAQLPLELENRIGDVQVFVDDPGISIVDSRQAKLSHFEGRALAEFGRYQLGGKPIAFGSRSFGETSAQESEKRIIGYIPEDRLSAILFALGKLAKYITFCGPWSLQAMLDEKTEEPRAKLAVHGEFSTLTLTNASAGAIAVRHLPIGAFAFAKAYAAEFGMAAADGAAALAARPRLEAAGLPDSEQEPQNKIGSHLALRPLLKDLVGEMAATADYFEFQRLAGRAPAVTLQMTGGMIAGFAAWLGSLLQLDIQTETPTQPLASPSLNFLEGARSGLLKLGNQLYDFVGGKFVANDGTTDKPAKNRTSAERQADLLAKFRKFSAQPISMQSLREIAVPLGAVVALLLGAGSAWEFWLSPIDNQLTSVAGLYDGTLAQQNKRASAGAAAAVEPVLWAKDVLSIAALMPYDMTLTHLTFTAARGGTPASLQVAGALPKSGTDNLQLIGRFMSRLEINPGLKKRLGDIAFAGAGDADSKDSAQMEFHFNAKVLAEAAP